MKCLIFSEPGTISSFVQELLLYKNSINSKQEVILRHCIGILLDMFVAIFKHTDFSILQWKEPDYKANKPMSSHLFQEEKYIRMGGLHRRLAGMFQLLFSNPLSQKQVLLMQKKNVVSFCLLLCFREDEALFFPFICFTTAQRLLWHCGSFCQSQRWGHAWLRKSKINLLSHTSTLNAAWNIIVSPCTLCFKEVF